MSQDTKNPKDNKIASEKPNERQGQWKCTGCSTINHAVRRLCASCALARKVWKCKDCCEQNDVRNDRTDACKLCKTTAPYVVGRNLNTVTGMWTCGKCGRANRERFSECFCARAGVDSQQVDDGTPQRRVKKEMKLGDWTCVDCKKHNFAKKLKCIRCYALKPLPNATTEPADE